MTILNESYELVDASTLVEHPANPRRGQTDLIVESIGANGFYGALVVQRSTNRVLAGNHRLKAAREEGIVEVPVLWVDVDDDRALRIMLMDNRSTDLATYDNESLAELLQACAEASEQLAGTGYEQSDLDALLTAVSAPVQATPRTVTAPKYDGPVDVRYIIGDVHEVLAGIPEGSVDLVISSPPFLALRSYLPADHPDKHLEMGSEVTPAEFLDALLEVTALCRRVLTQTGTLAFELGDSYSGSGGAGGDYTANGLRDGQPKFRQGTRTTEESRTGVDAKNRGNTSRGTGAGGGWPQAKSLCMIPEAYRMSLAYGRNILTGQPSPAGQWRIRNVVRWCRPNPPVGALGDKFRPATSEMVIACTSAKRWFDLDAVRAPGTAFDRNGETKGRLRAATECAEDGSGWMDGKPLTHNPAGAPPLDWWEIPTEPYPGSHYATWPTELLRIPILAMCPARVCRTCGEPSRRIVDTTYEAHGKVNPNERRLLEADALTNPSAQGMANGRATKIVDTLGWTDCGHGSYACTSCGVLVPYGNAIRRPREGQGSETQVSDEAVLGESVQGPSGQTQVPADVRDVPDRVPRTESNHQIVQPELLGETRASGGQSELHSGLGPGQREMEGRQKGPPSGLRVGVGATGDAGAVQERAHDGTPADHARASRPTVISAGDCPPPQRGEGRQPDLESRSGDPDDTPRDGDLPALPGDIPGQLSDGWVCICGSREVKYIADHWRRGHVLDPFGGSGTTAVVAALNERACTLIDLDERNAALACQRVGDQLTVTRADGTPVDPSTLTVEPPEDDPASATLSDLAAEWEDE